MPPTLDELRWDTATAHLPHIRWGLRRDIPAWLALDAACAAAFGREAETEDSLLTSLRERNCIAMTVDRGDTIVGFMVYELYRTHLTLARIAWAPSNPDAVGLLLVKLRSKVISHQRRYADVRVAPGRTAPLYLSPVLPVAYRRVPAEWVTSDVRALCGGPTHPYLPVLADALQDGGCPEDSPLLAELRAPGVGEAVYAEIAGTLRAK